MREINDSIADSEHYNKKVDVNKKTVFLVRSNASTTTMEIAKESEHCEEQISLLILLQKDYANNIAEEIINIRKNACTHYDALP